MYLKWFLYKHQSIYVGKERAWGAYLIEIHSNKSRIIFWDLDRTRYAKYEFYDYKNMNIQQYEFCDWHDSPPSCRIPHILQRTTLKNHYPWFLMLYTDVAVVYRWMYEKKVILSCCQNQRLLMVRSMSPHCLAMRGHKLKYYGEKWGHMKKNNKKTWYFMRINYNWKRI